eukprot:TRINITY_DN23491_c0_g1_i1.p2 TRINITY_DN23491_c0_g1~~TRINITY_DN23491_c0_g1_i1.p2  ORF type:complete len:103 (-),score=10.19 TRINITY_DN23491_c0_g1_i1:20-307(-)
MLVDDGWWEGIIDSIEGDCVITTHFPETNSYELITQAQHDDTSKESKRLRKGFKFFLKNAIWRVSGGNRVGSAQLNQVQNIHNNQAGCSQQTMTR